MAKKSYLPDLEANLESSIDALRAARAAAGEDAAGRTTARGPSIPGAMPGSPPDAAPAPLGAVAPPAPPGALPPPAAQAPSAPPWAPGAAAPRARRASRSRLALLVAAVVLVAVAGGIALALQHPNGASPGQVIATTTPGATPTPTAGNGGTPPAPVPSPVAVFIVPVLLAALLLLATLLLTRARRGAAAGQLASTVPVLTQGSVAALDMRIHRLEQLRTWMHDDPELGRLVDSTIGRQVHASERRQRVFSLALGIVTLAAGWLLSAVSPPGMVGRLFGH